MSTAFRVILTGYQEVHPPNQLDGKRRRDGHLRQRGGSRELLVRHPRASISARLRVAHLRRRRPTTMSPARIFTLRLRA